MLSRRPRARGTAGLASHAAGLPRAICRYIRHARRSSSATCRYIRYTRYALQVFLGYLLMLIAMTYQFELLAAAVGGLGLGHALLNLKVTACPRGRGEGGVGRALGARGGGGGVAARRVRNPPTRCADSWPRARPSSIQAALHDQAPPRDAALPSPLDRRQSESLWSPAASSQWIPPPRQNCRPSGSISAARCSASVLPLHPPRRRCTVRDAHGARCPLLRVSAYSQRTNGALRCASTESAHMCTRRRRRRPRAERFGLGALCRRVVWEAPGTRDAPPLMCYDL